LREEIIIRDGERRNADPRMVKVIRGYSDADLQAVADHVSRLPSAPK
jgi:cytochrome c553